MSSTVQDNRTVTDIVNADLCTGCAFCVAICPKQCILMNETAGGLLRPKVNQSDCINCTQCLQVCGGYSLHSEAIVPTIDPFTLAPLKSFRVRATASNLLLHGQSGGAVTAIAASLLRQGIVRGIITTIMPSDGSFHPIPILVRRHEDLFVSQGSQYVSVPLGQVMREINKADGPLAMIGLPCHFHSLFNAQKRLAPHWAELITLKIGLVCERVLSYAIFDCLLAIKSLTRLHCKYYRFRSKNRIGWPGEDNAVLWDNSSVTIPDHCRQKYKDCLTPLRCHLCFDKMNILADIIAADPWGFCRDKVGSTILAARTALGFQVIKDAAQQKDISLEPVTWQSILRGQHVEEKRLFWSNFTQFVKEKNEKIPNIVIEERRSSPHIVAKHFIPFFELIFQQSKLLSTAQTRQCVLDSIPHFQKNYDQSIQSIKENKK